MEPVARLKDLTFRYPHGDAGLTRISLTVHPADFVAVAGLTGCGKTTLLRHLKPEAYPAGTRQGSVELLGASPTDLLGSTAISYVPQRPRESLMAGSLRDELLVRLSATAPHHHSPRTGTHGAPDKSVRGVPGTVAGTRGAVPSRQARPLPAGLQVSDIVGFLGLAHLLDTPLENLSEGQAQLVALAAALATRPRLLLLDEPTASLDSVTRRTTLDLLRRLNQDMGMTIVMTEHHLQGVIEIATWLVALEDGRIVADGRPREAIRRLWDSGRERRRALIPDIPQWFLRTGEPGTAPAAAHRAETPRTGTTHGHGQTSRDDGPQTTPARLPLTVSEGRRTLNRLTPDPHQTVRPATYAPNAMSVIGMQESDPEDPSYDNDQDPSPADTPAGHPIAHSPHSKSHHPSLLGGHAGSRAFRISDVTASYPGLPSPAVEDLTLSARYGEILAVTGQSGSGKSTLLNLLFGAIRPDFGTISWYPPSKDGHNLINSPTDSTLNSPMSSLTDSPTDSHTDSHTDGFLWRIRQRHRHPARKMRGQIAYLPQDVRPVLNLEAGRHPDRLDEVTDPLNQSIGQQQLEALGIVVAQDRPVLLLDEPTQGLDALQKRHVGTILREQAARGRLVVLTTHDPQFYADYATRAAVMLAGRLVAEGPPRDIVASLDYSSTDLHRLLADRAPDVLTLADVVGTSSNEGHHDNTRTNADHSDDADTGRAPAA